MNIQSSDTKTQTSGSKSNPLTQESTSGYGGTESGNYASQSSNTSGYGGSESSRYGSNTSRSGSTSRGGVASREFHNFITDIEDLIQSATSLTGEDLTRAKEKINARIQSAKKTVENMSGEISERTHQAVKAADCYVHDQPWQAVGVGAVVGLVIGCLASRR